MRWASFSVLAIAAQAACGGATVPAAHVTSAQNTIAAADGAGASRIPQGQLHLQLARREYSTARSLMNQGDAAQADASLLRAQADAKLALSLAQEATAQAEAQQMLDRIRAISAPGQ